MIKFQRIATSDTALYDYMEKLMTNLFSSGRISLIGRNCVIIQMPNRISIAISFFHDDTPVGLITYWDFGHFYYIEHFAIDPAQRNGGSWKERTKPFMPTLKTSHRLGSGNTRRRNG